MLEIHDVYGIKRYLRQNNISELSGLLQWDKVRNVAEELYPTRAIDVP